MKRHLRFLDEETEQFEFSLSDKAAVEKIEWEGNDEFRFNGIMYDIVEKKIENGKLTIRCITDKKETELIKKYQDITKNNHGNSSKNKSRILQQLIGGLYTFPVNIPDAKIFSSEQHHFLKYIPAISSFSCDVITPPPRFL